MSAIRRNVGAITLFQKDLEQAKDFYTKVFGKPPDFSDTDVAVLHFDNIVVNLETEVELFPSD